MDERISHVRYLDFENANLVAIKLKKKKEKESREGDIEEDFSHANLSPIFTQLPKNTSTSLGMDDIHM